MRVALGSLLEGPGQIKPPDCEWPHYEDHLEHLGWQMGLPSIVLAPFAGAYGLLGIGHGSWPVKALLECLSDESPWCGVVSTGLAMDVLQQPPPLFGRDAALQDLGLTLLVKFSLDDDEGLSAACEPSSLRLIHREHLTDETSR
jgi:hypothetical protein